MSHVFAGGRVRKNNVPQAHATATREECRCRRRCQKYKQSHTTSHFHTTTHVQQPTTLLQPDVVCVIAEEFVSSIIYI